MSGGVGGEEPRGFPLSRSARDSRLGREVALKILPSAFANDPDRVRRFEQEGRAAAALNHPNIVVIYDAGSEGGVFYVATELLEGETLRERLASHALPVRKAVDYAIQIARGLAAAHAKGITHRDLKPENLFLTKDGLVKILDFGLAKHSATKTAGASHPTELATQPIEINPGLVLGTAGYMSPEQVRGQVADARSDLFSLGVVLYEMLSGKRAFTGETCVEVMNAILKQEPPALDAALPPALDRMIRRCLEKETGRTLSIGTGFGVCAGIDLRDYLLRYSADSKTAEAISANGRAGGRALRAGWRGDVLRRRPDVADALALVPAGHLPPRRHRQRSVC
jgi:serine/threonine protein kinase